MGFKSSSLLCLALVLAFSSAIHGFDITTSGSRPTNHEKAIHDFSKPLINMMKAAGWDLDAAANSVEPDVVYAKRAHKKYAFESYICQRMFSGFEQEGFSVKSDNITVTKESFFYQFLALRDMNRLDMLGQNPDSIFGKFCRSKYLVGVHPISK